MAAKKKPVSPTPPEKKTASPADFRKAEEESWRIYQETKRNPKDASGNSYFGGKAPMRGIPKGPEPKPNFNVSPGTPFKPGSPYDPKNAPKPAPMPKPPVPKSPSKPKTPDTPTTTTTTQPRGMAQSGKVVSSDSMAKKKKKK